MTQQEEHLVQFMTTKLTAHSEAEAQARNLLHEMTGELASELVALKVQVKDLRTLAGNQGLAIDHLGHCYKDSDDRIKALQRKAG